MRQGWIRKLQKPVIRKNRICVPSTKCSGATFGVLKLIYKQQNEIQNRVSYVAKIPYAKVLVARLTVE